MGGTEPEAPAMRSPTDGYWACEARSQTGPFTRHGTGPASLGTSAASAPLRSAGAAKGISACGSLACAIRLKRSTWLALQLWKGGARRDAASVGGRERDPKHHEPMACGCDSNSLAKLRSWVRASSSCAEIAPTRAENMSHCVSHTSPCVPRKASAAWPPASADHHSKNS